MSHDKHNCTVDGRCSQCGTDPAQMTDKIKPATNEQISGLRKHLEAMEYPSQQYFSMIGSEALSLIARIEAQQAEIEELKSERDVDVIGERDQAAKLLAEATKEIERLNDELQAQVESYRDRVSEIERLRGLCVEADSYLSLLRHRYIRTDTPDDLRQDVDRVIGAIRNASKGEL